MENFNYLGVINGIYNLSAEADEFNIISRVSVFINKDEDALKIINYSEYYEDKILTNISTREKILELGPNEVWLIKSNFNKNLIKELIFYKFLDAVDDYLSFAKIY